MTLYYTLVSDLNASLLGASVLGVWSSMVPLTVSNPQVFMLLMAEMALFMFLIIPMPFSLKRRVFTYVPPFMT